MSDLLWEVQVAAAATMLADDQLTDKLDGDKVYDTEVPRGQTRPHRYVVIAESPGEVPAGSFGRGGKDSLLWFHVWDDGWRRDEDAFVLGNENPRQITADLERLFHGKRLTLDQWTMKLGELSVVRLVRDSTLPYMHAVMQYRILGAAPVAP